MQVRRPRRFRTWRASRETWRLKITKVTKTAVFALGLECLALSSSRVEPVCRFFKYCGGCDLMHMSYEAELNMKRSSSKRRISAYRRTIPRNIRHRAVRCHGALPQQGRLYYFRGKRCSRFRLLPGGRHDVVAIDRCLLQSETADRAAAAVCGWMKRNGIRAFDEKSGRGGSTPRVVSPQRQRRERRLLRRLGRGVRKAYCFAYFCPDRGVSLPDRYCFKH